MTDRPGCAETRQVIPDLAAGVVPAEERAEALRHLARCGRCHRELEAQTAIVDELLGLVPERQPPAGFEARVLAPLQRKRRPRRLRAVALPAALVLIAAGTAGGAVWRHTAADRELAGTYRRTLAVAHGRYLRTVPVDGGDTAPAGYVFAYQGSPTWLFVTLTAAHGSGPCRMSLTTRDGREIDLGTMDIRDDRGSWGTTIPVAVHDILVMRFSGPAGRQSLARFG